MLNYNIKLYGRSLKKGGVNILKRYSWLTLANCFTLSRFVLGAVGVTLLALGFKWWGVSTLVMAFLTDFIDGQVARRLNHVTDLGAMLDPLADKLLVSEIIIYLVICKNLPKIPAILILLCEFILIILAIYLKFKGKVVHSIWVGKLKFQFQWLALFAYLFNITTIGFWILIIVVIMTIASLISHIDLGWKALKGA